MDVGLVKPSMGWCLSFMFSSIHKGHMTLISSSVFNFLQNPTLEHYASYKAPDLKATVLALQDLQLNNNDCPLTAIRMKYSQDKVWYHRKICFMSDKPCLLLFYTYFVHKSIYFVTLRVRLIC
jgi:hypothetical protein